jgi:hypothetical protein
MCPTRLVFEILKSTLPYSMFFKLDRGSGWGPSVRVGPIGDPLGPSSTRRYGWHLKTREASLIKCASEKGK